MRYKSNKNYTKVQFVGHVLSTTPQLIESVEDMCDRGIYLGESDDTLDIQERLDIVNDVLGNVLKNTSIDKDTSTLKVFTMPEFFWRGIRGAYYYSDASLDEFYRKIYGGLLSILQNYSKHYALDDWLFIFGSALTTNAVTSCSLPIDSTLSQVGDNYLSVYDIIKKHHVRNGKSIPKVSELLKALDGKVSVALSNEDQALSALLKNVLDMSDNLAQKKIYNRALVFYGTSVSYSVQKQNKSKEDFILNNPSEAAGVVNDYLQTMVIYPDINDQHNPVPTIPLSAFTCQNVKIGIEICLDHKRKRLEGYVYESLVSPVDIQIVISCGMQLLKDSVATHNDGILFNCDGEYELKVDGKPDAENGDCCHSQLKTAHFDASTGWILSAYIPAASKIPLGKTDLYPHKLGSIHVYAPMAINFGK
jgi:hypothetical protein